MAFIIGFFTIIILRRIKITTFLLFSCLLILPTISVFITVLLHSAEASEGSNRWLSFHYDEASVALALFLSLRSAYMAAISFAAVLAIKYDKFILSLMQNLKLPVSVGYSVLATFNAFFHIKNELVRINWLNQMSFNNRRSKFMVVIPLMVSTIRYAHQAGLSLEAKGLNPRKTFLYRTEFRKRDFVIVTFHLLIAISLLKINSFVN